MEELKKYLIDGEEVTQEEFEERLEKELEIEIENSIDGWIDSFKGGIEFCGYYVPASEILRRLVPKSFFIEYKLAYEEYLRQEIEDRFSMGCYARLNYYDFEIEEVEEDEESEEEEVE